MDIALGIATITVGHIMPSPIRRSPRSRSNATQPISPQVQIGVELLKIEYQKAFEIHQDYKKALTDLIRLCIMILNFPILIAAALVGANLLGKAPTVVLLLDLDVICYAMLVAGVVNVAVVRVFVINDRVYVESKHHINRLRELYLTYLSNLLPSEWSPYWGGRTQYSARAVRVRGATLTIFVFAAINAVYITHGLTFLLKAFASFHPFWWSQLTTIAIVWIIQQEFTVAATHRSVEWIRSRLEHRK